MGMEPAKTELREHFAHGTYTRELLMPKGTCLTGKIHRYSCINIVSLGSIRCVTDEGEYIVEAPHIFVSGDNVCKAIYAVEDSILINVHPWNGEDTPEQIEEKLIFPVSALLECEQ